MFVPYKNFDYNDKWFLKINDNKLFPPASELKKFHDRIKDVEQKDLIGLAYLISVSGYINGLDKVITPKFEHSFEHLEFLLSHASKEFLSDIRTMDSGELDSLIVFMLSYVLDHWFEIKSIEHIFPYSVRLLHPLRVTKIIGIENLFNDNDTSNLIDLYIDKLNIDLKKCRMLANKISFYGYNAEMLRVLEPRESLNYKAVMDIVDYYIRIKDMEGASKILAIYFPKSSIDATIKLHY